ncbi:MAG: hypothetical protein CL927_04130 [Deltaproteobacteria bacterium]|nr:hypothetical protein [Deltaproteobacteria bacterium]
MNEANEDSEAVLGSEARRVRVLVAEDNPVNQMVMEAMLGSADIEVVLVDNGADCVRRIAAVQPDAVLMDCQMPICDGYSASRQLRAAGWSLPIIAVTASALGDEEARCRQAGMDAFMAKPVRRDALLEVIEHFCSATVGGTTQGR